ncbi:MAG: hypothetical protein Q8M76_03725, partial [Spirochaetaceae bacterium]|nr:hypothetical protein [Spirochaetaceae bacterium]
MKFRCSGPRSIAAIVCAAIGIAAAAETNGLVAGATSYARGEKPILLIGPWENYEGIMTEEAIRSSSPGFTIATLRSSLLRPYSRSEGSVTYRARVKIRTYPGDEAGGIGMAIFFPGLGDFEALYIDGTPIYERNRGESAIAPLFFESRGEEISVLLRSGPHDRRLDEPSLFPAFCLIGEGRLVVKAQLALICAATIVPAYSIMTAFLLFMFFLFWRKNREFLAFSLYVASLALFYMTKHVLLLGFLDLRLPDEFREIAYITARG